MPEAKFYRCNTCGNIVALIRRGGGTLSCCGSPMEELVAGSTDAATEKHVPQVSVEGDQVVVTVGSVEHPMLEEHYIQFIALATEDGVTVRYLKPGMKPQATFAKPAGAFTAYEYCNLHGLWKAEA
ncbi:desulfoferrodoxin family protein [Olsenella sp. DNF00959]|uniref:desulfoferrodoxin family protein n=1 Tax=Olsenella sp. DNF00959 TaxID=1476999 RepID=UPI000782452D|nr:desulfoferrodoxin family protein [Olsenella sp. DNF00959]KXB62402.1 superoxide reductase [Olsenella sp. DNF00959]